MDRTTEINENYESIEAKHWNEVMMDSKYDPETGFTKDSRIFLENKKGSKEIYNDLVNSGLPLKQKKSEFNFDRLYQKHCHS